MSNVAEGVAKLNIDSLIVVGGFEAYTSVDGTNLHIFILETNRSYFLFVLFFCEYLAMRVSRSEFESLRKVHIVAIPATISSNLPASEVCI